MSDVAVIPGDHTEKNFKATNDLFYRDQIDKASKETKVLRTRIEQLEKENLSLKKSVFDLTNKIMEIKQQNIGSQNKYFLPDFTVGEASPPTNSKKSVKEFSSDFHLESSNHINDNNWDVSFAELTKGKVKKPFQLKNELKSHSGAVYSVEFSNNSRLLASGSFDKTIRLWSASDFSELSCLRKHTLCVSDLSWSPDSSEVLSSSFDQTCKIWDIESSRNISSFESDGFVHTLKSHPADPFLFYYSNSKKSVTMVDKRTSNQTCTIRNDSIVFGIHVYYSSQPQVLTGDSSGCIKTWDMRHINGCIQEDRNESHSAICGLALTTDSQETEPRFLAVNCYDNIIRLYDRGDNPGKSNLKLLSEIRGPQFKNWPIKNAFYRLNYDKFDGDDTDPLTGSFSHLLATGSTDSSAYVNSLSLSNSVYSPNISKKKDNNHSQVQLQGHSDRVYSVAFNSKEFELVTAGADFSIRVWKGVQNSPSFSV